MVLYGFLHKLLVKLASFFLKLLFRGMHKSL